MWWARKIHFIFFRIIVAPCMILGGAFFLFLPFAFMTMQDPERPLVWGEYLGKLLRDGSESFVIGVAMIVFGAMIAAIPLPGTAAKSS